jgi:hypothetical protein
MYALNVVEEEDLVIDNEVDDKSEKSNKESKEKENNEAEIIPNDQNEDMATIIDAFTKILH